MLAHDATIVINIAQKYAIIAFGYVIITPICCTKFSKIVYVTKIVAQKHFMDVYDLFTSLMFTF